MMPSSIGSVRARIARVRESLLLQGPGLTQVLIDLESAAQEMRGFGPDTSAAELEALRTELAGVAKLARHGEDFWRAWGRLSGIEPGYTSNGVLAESPTARIAVQG